jgi:hypothetical protein
MYKYNITVCFTEFIEFWLNSIHAHTRGTAIPDYQGPPAILVGTHRDKVGHTCFHYIATSTLVVMFDMDTYNKLTFQMYQLIQSLMSITITCTQN